jgi:hypothetical protein
MHWGLTNRLPRLHGRPRLGECIGIAKLVEARRVSIFVKMIRLFGSLAPPKVSPGILGYFKSPHPRDAAQNRRDLVNGGNEIVGAPSFSPYRLDQSRGFRYVVKP